jgi:hypothetical protein
VSGSAVPMIQSSPAVPGMYAMLVPLQKKHVGEGWQHIKCVLHLAFDDSYNFSNGQSRWGKPQVFSFLF